VTAVPYRTCSEEDCERKRRARGYCSTHLSRLRRTGSLAAPPPRARRTCSEEGCERTYHTRGYCAMHISRLQRTGSLAAPPPPRRTCSEESCERKHHGHGYCLMHSRRLRSTGSLAPPPPRTCSEEGCERKHRSHGFCNTHGQRWRKTGDPGPAQIGQPPSTTYKAVHNHLRQARGSAREHPCHACLGPAHEWAYDHQGGESELTETLHGGTVVTYSASLERFVPLCRSCHRQVDFYFARTGKEDCRRRHRLAGANRAKRGGCLACRRAKVNAYDASRRHGETWTEQQIQAAADGHYARIMAGPEQATT